MTVIVLTKRGDGLSVKDLPNFTKTIGLKLFRTADLCNNAKRNLDDGTPEGSGRITQSKQNPASGIYT